MKKTTKKFKPAFIVDITGCMDISDMYWEFIYAKVGAGIPITTYDLDYIIYDAMKESLYTALNLQEAIKEFSTMLKKLNDCSHCKCNKPKKHWWEKLMFWKD